LALAFNRSNTLFVSCYESIIEISPNGMQSTFASGLQFSSGVAFDGEGNLFAVDQKGNPGAGEILEFTNNAGTLSANVTIFASGLNQPWGLAFNSAGNLFVPDQGSGNIYEFSPGGLQSTFVSGFDFPEGLAFEPAAELLGTATNGVFLMTVTMPSPYYSTVVQASTNLVNWSDIYTNTPPFTFSDAATGFSERYYRAILGP
jgi:glucose/arabinose dehydrogenase